MEEDMLSNPCFPAVTNNQHHHVSNNPEIQPPHLYRSSSIVGRPSGISSSSSSCLMDMAAAAASGQATTTTTSSSTTLMPNCDAQFMNSLVYSLSILKEKVSHIDSMMCLFISSSPNSYHNHTSNSNSTTTTITNNSATTARDQHESISMLSSPSMASRASSMALANMGTLIQEVVVTASSMMFSCQQIALSSPNSSSVVHKSTELIPAAAFINISNTGAPYATATNSSPVNDKLYQAPDMSFMKNGDHNSNHLTAASRGQDMFTTSSERFYGYGRDSYNITSKIDDHRMTIPKVGIDGRKRNRSSPNNETLPIIRVQNCDIIELDAADLLAKYTHYCQVCGKGFKRDANLRMHMRAHGDEYKSSAALSNPLKKNSNEHQVVFMADRKYSCPQEGCRWNRKHAKFQPLKSMICVKNHYKRSHCPKMYVCKRCNRKQFSVLSDLRTHEKHCGDLRWQCSCGTTFSRKDKLMGHIALFVGHTQVIPPSAATATGIHTTPGFQSSARMQIN